MAAPSNSSHDQDSIAAAAERIRNELDRLDVLWTTRVRSTTVRARVAAPTALLIRKSVRDVLPHSLSYWNDSTQKSAGNGNGCG
jgi:hypothetical protein